MEILADLRKADDIETGQAEVQRLANKLVPACSYMNVGFREIVIGNYMATRCRLKRPTSAGAKASLFTSGDKLE